VLKADELADIEADFLAIRDRLPTERGSPVDAQGRPALSADRARCLDAGMDDHLTKPVRIEDIRAAIVRWVLEAGDDRSSSVA